MNLYINNIIHISVVLGPCVTEENTEVIDESRIDEERKVISRVCGHTRFTLASTQTSLIGRFTWRKKKVGGRVDMWKTVGLVALSLPTVLLYFLLFSLAPGRADGIGNGKF